MSFSSAALANISEDVNIPIDWAKVCRNIYYIAKANDLKITELEIKIGVSQGYLKRVAKSDKMSPSASTIVRLASALGVSIDALIYDDLSTETDGDKTCSSFIKRLKDDTVDAKLRWDQLFDVPNLLLQTVDSDNGLLSFASAYHPIYEYDNEELCMPIYSASITSDITVYIVRLEYSSGGETHNEYELYMMNNTSRTISPVCHSTVIMDSSVSRELKSLYSTVSNSTNHANLPADVLDAINAYMTPQVEMDDSDELPY